MTSPVEVPAQQLSPIQLESIAIEVAQAAATLILQSTGQARLAGTKSSPTDLVTETDVAAEHLIRQELGRRSPGSSIVGEELADSDGGGAVGWIVDPLDGTVNFAYDLPVISVSIAATVGDRVVAGAVTDVLRGETFSAVLGGGARRDGHPIGVGDQAELAQALILTGFSYDAGTRAGEAQILTRVLPAARDIRCMGSAALNLCWVACGRGDGFFERDLKVYDYAAGALIALEAGAAVHLPGSEPPPVPGTTSSADDLVLAVAPRLERGLLELVAG